MQILKAKNPKVTQFGDFPYGNNVWISQYKPEFLDLNDLFLLEFLDFNPFKALNKLGYDSKELMDSTMYQDPWMDNKYYSVLPIGIIGKFDTIANKFSDAHWYPMAGDTEWLLAETDISHDRVLHTQLPRIGQLSMGHGFTPMLLPSDGHSSIIPCVIETDGPELIFAATRCWHSK